MATYENFHFFTFFGFIRKILRIKVFQKSEKVENRDFVETSAQALVKYLSSLDTF